MSHVAQCKVVVKSLDTLEAAVKRLGGTLHRGQTKIRWWGQFVDDSSTWKQFFSAEEAARIAKLPQHERKRIINKEMGRADHVITFPGTTWDLGVMQESDGTFRLRWDTYSGGGGLNKIIGSSGGLIGQAYAIEAAKKAARRKGYMITEKKEANGSIKLQFAIQ